MYKMAEYLNKKKYKFLRDIVDDNIYINKCKTNKKKDIHSLSYLIDIKLSQSDCIKMGFALENIFKDLILSETYLKNIKPRNVKGSKEKDHLFFDKDNDTIYYAELKSNLNLDTEKSKSTCQKLIFINEELKDRYNSKIKSYLVCLRYLSKNDISETILNKYKPIKKNVIGINEYLERLNIDFQFDYENYKEFLNYVAIKLC